MVRKEKKEEIWNEPFFPRKNDAIQHYDQIARYLINSCNPYKQSIIHSSITKNIANSQVDIENIKNIRPTSL